MSSGKFALFSRLICRNLLLLALLALHDSHTLAIEANASQGIVGSEVPEEPLTLTILHCCPEGMDLDEQRARDHGNEPVMAQCILSSEVHQPLIYSPSTRGFLHQYPDDWRTVHGRLPECSEDQVIRYVPQSQHSAYVLFDDGNVALEGGIGTIFRPEEYCFGTKSLLACMPRREEGRQDAVTMLPKMLKCCGPSAVYVGNACKEIDTEATTIHEEDNMLLAPKFMDVVEIGTGFPSCSNSDNLTIFSDYEKADLQADASILIDGQILPAEEFCVERIEDVDSKNLALKIFTCSEHANKEAKRDIRFTLYPMGFIISAIFLAATLASGWLLPASHHVLHWRCQTYHVACLMLGDISMAVIQLTGNSLQGEWCTSVAIIAQFFFLASFFWLNTMCFNIWWTFRDLRPASLEKGQELLRLKFYSAYAWGGPLIISGLAAFIDHLPYTPEQTFLKPRFGEKRCWFYGDMEMLTYFFGPIGLLLAINLLFFSATARELTCGLWKGEFVKSTTERSRAIPRTNEKPRQHTSRRAALSKVCLKLVVVMGVPWIFDVVSWLAGGPAFLWYLTDVLNAAQGVLIFIVVGCQPQVRAALKRLWSCNPRANASRQGNGLSTTSHGMPSMGDSVTQNPSTKTVPLETIC